MRLRAPFLAAPATALFALHVAFIPITFVGVGVVALLLIVPVTGAYAGLHRRLAGWILREDLHTSYRDTHGMTPLRRLSGPGRGTPPAAVLAWLKV